MVYLSVRGSRWQTLCIILTPFLVQMTVVVSGKFNYERFLQSIDSYHITHLLYALYPFPSHGAYAHRFRSQGSFHLNLFFWSR